MVPMTGAITAAATFARSLASPIAAPRSTLIATLRYLDSSQSAPLEIGPKRGSDDFRSGEPYVAQALTAIPGGWRMEAISRMTPA
jgi:hypothetical protein